MIAIPRRGIKCFRPLSPTSASYVFTKLALFPGSSPFAKLEPWVTGWSCLRGRGSGSGSAAS